MSMNSARIVWERLRLLNRLPGAHAAYRWLTNFAYPDGATLTLRRGPAAGYLWRHDRSYQFWMSAGMYEPHVAQLIFESLQPGDVFYDVGANAGYFSLVGAKAVGKDGNVVAFDPHPHNAHTIGEQIRLNDLGANCVVEPFAIADRSGQCQFVLAFPNANAHIHDINAPHVTDNGNTIDVPMETLDNYVATHPWPTLIKMDIEGAEVAALAGATQLLHSDRRPAWLISTHSAELESEVKRVLQDHGYNIRNLPGFEQMVWALPDGANQA